MKRLAANAFTSLVGRASGILTTRHKAKIRERLSTTMPLDYGNGEIKIWVDSEHERKKRVHCAAKEQNTIRWLESFCSHDTVFFDVGANVGSYSLIAASLNPSLQVVAFEPSFPNFHQLCRNIMLNTMGDRIFPLCLPLGESNGSATFYFQDMAPGAARHHMEENVAVSAPSASASAMTVPVVRMDKVIDLLGLPFPTMLKIDVDGHEPHVLTGAGSILADPRLKTVLIEQMDRSDCSELLIQSGFAQHELCDERNLIFTR